MLEVKNLVKVYKTKGGVETKALDNVSVNFPETGLVFLLGKSGSGKSTLLNMIGGLDRPDSGEIVVKGRSSKDFSQADFDSYRNTYIGFIFQEYNVLNEFNIEQNISLALQLQGKKNDKEAVNNLLKEVDLEGFNRRKPNTLSGGQKQRIAIARALIKQPEIIMADEPTGALDSTTGKQVLETLKKLSKKKLVIIVSHDQDFAEEYGDRIIELKDGKIISDKSKEFVAPKAVNDKIQIINGNVIDIKKGSDLTEADFKQLYQMIKKQDKEVLISTGAENIKSSKKAMRISDSGHGERFTDTKGVEVKQYDGKQTKFIRSHMPFSRSFKMGASGLKTKPIRLIFTILLSVVSFTMFGVASTLMLYDPAYSLATAMENSDRKSEGIAKQYKYKYQQYQVNRKTGEKTPYGEPDKRTYRNYAYFGEQEYKDLNAANNNRFIGVFTLTQLNSSRFESDLEAFRFSGIEVSEESKGKSFYYCNYFTGLSDGDASFFTNNGYHLTGKHPEKEDEIAISNYHYDLIRKSEVFGTINTPNDVLNKTLSFPVRTKDYGEKTLKMKIVGVYDFGPLTNKFDALLSERQSSVSPTDRESMEKNFKAYLGTSLYTTGYVSTSFYDKYGFVYDNNHGSYVEPTFLKGFNWIESEPDPAWKVNEDDRRNAYTIEALKSNSGVNYYDLDFNKVSSPIDLNGDEVLLPYRSYARSREAYKYSEVPTSMLDILKNVRWECYVSRLDTVVTDIENRNRGSEDPIVLAAIRVSDNYWSYLDSGDYPDECNIDDDLATVKNGYNALYKIAGRNYYLLQLDQYLRDVDYTYSSDTTIQGYVDKIRDYTVDATTLNLLEDAMESYLSTYPEAPMYAMGRTVYNFAYSDNKNLIDEKAEELFPSQGTLNNVINELSGKRSDTDYINNLDILLKYASTVVTGSECDPKTLNPLFLTNMVVPEEYSKEYKLYSKDYNDVVKEYTVRGFFEISNGGDEGAVAFASDSIKSYVYSEGGKGGEDDIYYTGGELTDYVAPSDVKYAYLMTATNYSQAEIASLTKDMGSYNYTMTNAIFTEANGWTETIEELQLIFLIIGGVTGGLAALLLLNFISVSISSKNKDIGILRAVGARGSDVFKIFFSESSIIALICFVISAIAGGIVCYYLNNMVKATAIGIGLLNYGVINILLILGVSVVISFIATFIPVMIASKKPPVEAIRAL